MLTSKKASVIVDLRAFLNTLVWSMIFRQLRVEADIGIVFITANDSPIPRIRL